MFAFGGALAADLETTVRAANSGDVDAMHNLGAIYANGDLAGQDYAKAYEWFYRAALKGQHNSMYSLAVMHRLGQGREVDLIRAYAWYSLAADHIPKDADEWFIPRAKVAMFLRRPGELERVLSASELSRARELRQELAVGIERRQHAR
jgi:hypothetical protein